MGAPWNPGRSRTCGPVGNGPARRVGAYAAECRTKKPGFGRASQRKPVAASTSTSVLLRTPVGARRLQAPATARTSSRDGRWASSGRMSVPPLSDSSAHALRSKGYGRVRTDVTVQVGCWGGGRLGSSRSTVSWPSRLDPLPGMLGARGRSRGSRPASGTSRRTAPSWCARTGSFASTSPSCRRRSASSRRDSTPTRRTPRNRLPRTSRGRRGGAASPRGAARAGSPGTRARRESPSRRSRSTTRSRSCPSAAGNAIVASDPRMPRAGFGVTRWSRSRRSSRRSPSTSFTSPAAPAAARSRRRNCPRASPPAASGRASRPSSRC